MSGAPDVSEQVRLLAEQAGLDKALKLFPDGVKAAVERGLRPIGDPPKGHVPTASPAPVFNPAAFEKGKYVATRVPDAVQREREARTVHC